MLSSSVQRACQAGVGIRHAAVASSRVSASCGRQQSVVHFDKRSEPCDRLKLKLARRETSILRSQDAMTNSAHFCVVAATASQALQDKAASLFASVCVNPKVLSPEAAEFMLSVAASCTTLSPAEAEAAAQVDVVLKGVHPTSFQPVLLVCTTTMFAMPVLQGDVDKAKRRAELWQRAVGPAIVIVPVVAGFALPLEISALASSMGVVSCDISNEQSIEDDFCHASLYVIQVVAATKKEKNFVEDCCSLVSARVS